MGDVWRQVRESWGDDISPVPENVVAPVLSAPTRAFLTSVGLPTGAPWDIAFHPDERLSTVVTRPGREYVAVGQHDNGFVYAVDVADDRVYELHRDRAEPTRLVNSTLALFVWFLGVYRSRLPTLATVTQEEGGLIVGDLRDMFTAADPVALSHDGTWWSVVLYETEMGYF